MAVDYDLIIVGSTPAAQTAAITAAKMYARIAWVTDTSPILLEPLALLREGTQSRSHLAEPEIPQPKDWMEWFTVLESALDRDPKAMIQAYGVNYLEGPIQFYAEKGLSMTVGEQLLRSRSYLLAMEPEQFLPSIPGIEHSQVWSISQLLNQLKSTLSNWPKHLTILGNGPQAVEMSQSVKRLGIAVLLLTDGHPLLPQEDPDIAVLLQAYLEGNGISINMSEKLTQVLPSKGGQLCLQLNQLKVKTEALVIAAEGFNTSPSYLTSLNLKQNKPRLWVNSTLQTSYPNVYACGPILGGYTIPGIASHEARIAVQNALLEQRLPIQYHHVPYVILSDPPLARVGLTEQQARWHDPQIQIIKQNYGVCDRALSEQAPVGLCKVLVQSNGKLLGAHIIGTCAQELIHLFALAMQKDCSLQDLDRLAYGSPTFTQVIQQVAQQWQHSVWRKQRDYNERWFYKRRSNYR